MIQSISVLELQNLNNINIIDIRSNEKYNHRHIPGAINIVMNDLLIKPEKYLNKLDKYYIYCQKGIQSRKLCQILTNMGYNVININGGYEKWLLNE